MNVKVISRNVGLALLVSALFMFFSIIVSLMNGGDSALTALCISFILTFTVGVFPFIFVRKTPSISLQDGFMIIILSWILSFIFGMFPYLLWGEPFTVINAWFESVSGYTTTGATILQDVEALPKSLLFWRSSTNFIGGLGVVVFLLLIIPQTSQIRLRLSSMEVSSLSREGYNMRINKTTYIFAHVYLGLAVAAFLCFLLAGMSPFDAVCHAMSVSATGGFSTKNLSIAYFDSLPVTLVTMLFMFLCSIHFGMLFMVLVNRSIVPLKNPVFKFYVSLIVVSSFIVAVSLKFNDSVTTWGQAILNGSFHVLSYASSTGVAIADNAGWPYITGVILHICGICCGMAGSTTGGIKSDRVVMLWHTFKQSIYRTIHPSAVFDVKLGNRTVRDSELNQHTLYIALYFFLLFLSVVLCLMVGKGSGNALSATLSTFSNIGPGMGTIGTFGNYSMEPEASKIIYTANMFLGRIEIYPAMALLYMLFSSGRKKTI